MDHANRSVGAGDGLPDDTLVEILSHLPAKSLFRFKCISKSWCDLITDRLRCRKLPRTLEGFFYGCVDGIGSNVYGFGYSSSEDEDECGGKDENLPNQVRGHFINLLGRPVPLVDSSFSFLRKQPGINKNLTLFDSCNGLLLFVHTRGRSLCNTEGYIVCNPATEHWVHVSRSGFPTAAKGESMDKENDYDDYSATIFDTHLIFDPVVSSHFQLIELCQNSELTSVRTYSSKTKSWCAMLSERKRWKRGGEWDLVGTIGSLRGSAFFNKMMHLIVSPSSTGPELIVAIDGKGKACRVISSWQENRGFPVFVGQSKGLLHCISVSEPADGNSCNMTELSIWVLEECDAEVWNLKHTVSFSELFGRKSCQFGTDYNVATIHPDHNLVYFVQHWDYKLISYDMDRKEVCAICNVGCDYRLIFPYVPYFSKSPALSKKN
ncbi:unnamed protein product [Urochloa humidicola]